MAKVKAKDFGDKRVAREKPSPPSPAQVDVVRRFFKTDTIDQLMDKTGLSRLQVSKLREDFVRLAESRASETAHYDAAGRPLGAHSMNQGTSELNDEMANFVGSRITREDISKAIANGDKKLARELREKLGEQIANERELQMRLHSDQWIRP